MFGLESRHAIRDGSSNSLPKESDENVLELDDITAVRGTLVGLLRKGLSGGDRAVYATISLQSWCDLIRSGGRRGGQREASQTVLHCVGTGFSEESKNSR
jgi:hypothetical protein